MNVENKKLFEDLSEEIHSFRKFIQKFLPFLECEVDQLIKSKITHNGIIESYLDTLLSLTEIEVADDLFIKLLEYCKALLRTEYYTGISILEVDLLHDNFDSLKNSVILKEMLY